MQMTNFQNFISVLTLGGKKVEYEQCEKGTVPQVPCVALLKMASFCIFWVKNQDVFQKSDSAIGRFLLKSPIILSQKSEK